MDIVGIGVDLVDVARMRRIIDRRSTFVRRVFDDEEIAYCSERPSPAECYAARWAAREACRKALRFDGGMSWKDVRVERSRNGLPRLALSGGCRARAEALGVSDVLVSLSHDGGMAAAFCVAVRG